MIDEVVKIHDKFSVEIKLGFIARRKQEISDFTINTWIFVPQSLDINPATYSKTDFYRDLKSNIRLITPVYLLRDITGGEKSPVRILEKSFQNLASNPTRTRIADYEYHIKMFLSILKSTLREEIKHFGNNVIQDDKSFLVEQYISSVSKIITEYRALRHVVNVPTVTREVLNYYFFGDEFMSNLIEQNTFKLLSLIKGSFAEKDQELIEKLLSLIQNEIAYKKEKGYPVVEKDCPDRNRRLLSRLGLLKKFAENELYLGADKRKDGVLIEQVYLSIAAGISMVFATAVAFSIQQKYGNFTMPFFVALVISYMLKDRIKELFRYYFAHKLGSRYFDQKTYISLKGYKIGSGREAVDHIAIDKVPDEVIKLRSRSSVFEDYARQHADSVMLYRKMISINRRNLDKVSNYPTQGINEIIRMNVSNFLLKMANAEVPLFVTDENTVYAMVKGEKVYYLNLVMQLKNEKQMEYRHYRIVMNRKGILDIEKIV